MDFLNNIEMSLDSLMNITKLDETIDLEIFYL